MRKHLLSGNQNMTISIDDFQSSVKNIEKSDSKTFNFIHDKVNEVGKIIIECDSYKK